MIMKYRNNDGEIDYSLFCIVSGKNKREGGQGMGLPGP